MCKHEKMILADILQSWTTKLGEWHIYLQSHRMFFWWELCKLPREHWHFDWQFESSKLQPAQTSCSVHLVPRGKNSLRFSKMFKCYFNIVKTGLRVFSWMNNRENTNIFQIAWKKKKKKLHRFSLRRWQPANHNIIQRSFFANIYQYWRGRQFTCLRSF